MQTSLGIISWDTSVGEVVIFLNALPDDEADFAAVCPQRLIYFDLELPSIFCVQSQHVSSVICEKESQNLVLMHNIYIYSFSHDMSK